MSKAKFPQKRDDGSFSVSARFAVSNDDDARRVEEVVSAWVTRKTVDDHIDLMRDLAAVPHIVARSEDELDIVFDGKPRSVYWKDWMVMLTRELMSAPNSLRFVAFYDLVSNMPHPASLSLWHSWQAHSNG